MVRKGFLWILILLFSAGCGIINIKKSGYSAERFEDYSEDLTSSRITFEELPEVKEPKVDHGAIRAGAGSAVDKDLEEALTHNTNIKKEEPYFSGFTILVYSGVDRDLAFKTRNDLYSVFPDINAEMQYEQPRYLVKVGKYINRIEALKLFEKIDEEFPTARIIQDRFKRETLGNEQDLEDAEE
ncbi:MAG: hypothetical protein WD426_19725 [Anditalea sp.]